MSRSISRKKKYKKGGSIGSRADEPDPSVLTSVIEKLRNHPDYKDKPNEEIQQTAKILYDKDELHSEFSHLICDTYEQHAGEIAEEMITNFCHSLEEEMAKKRAMGRIQAASSIPIKLLLRELQDQPGTRFASRFAKLFAMNYGALHAAIQVGDVLLEWDNSSLVIPDKEHYFQDPVFQTDMRASTPATQGAIALRPQMTTAINNHDFYKQIDLHFELSIGVESMLEPLKRVIVEYNRYYYYHVIFRNCQSFVIDAMKALGVDPPKSFTGALQGYFKALKEKKTKLIPSEFPKHEDLDRHMRDADLAKLSQHEKEYLLCMYFQFHLEAMKKDKDPNEPCKVRGCQMEVLEDHLENGQPIILQQYLHQES